MGDVSIIGIDLGTTNSAAAVWTDGAARLIPNSLGHVLTPSAVSLTDEGEVLVGLAARDRQATHPDRTVTAFKRYMGSRRETWLGDKLFLPEELSALVLRSLKADAEAHLGRPVHEAVITVPAYFNDRQRKATRRAGELAGLKVERLVNEPTAAALAYGIHQLGGDEQKFLVFDLGGGTFDVSVIELFEGVIEVRASTGDNRLGGEDFNQVLIDMMRERFHADWGKSKSEDALHQRLREAAERARRALTTEVSAKLSIVWKDRPYEIEVTADAFEAASKPLIDRLREPVLRAIRDASIPVEGLNEIILIGGSTRMPLVKRTVTRMFGRFPAVSINPDEAVALGAAVQAGLKARNADLSEVVMTDVCPYTLGVDIGERGAGGSIRGGIFSPIIERNTAVPVSRVQTYSTMQDGQKVIELGIYQGESRLVSENIRLDQITVKVPPRPANEIQVDVRFSYDTNGLLEVDITVPATGAKHQKLIVEAEGMSETELAERRAALAALKVHPRDLDANRAALSRAHRCFEDALGDKRALIGQMIAQFEMVLEAQDPRQAERARDQLIEQLDQLEGPAWL